MKKSKKLAEKSVWDLHVENFLIPVWKDHVGWMELLDGSFMENLGKKPVVKKTFKKKKKVKSLKTKS
tara:strand:- start:1009 stop:1209 length:201 start_codon:yes stop_codon:yes gene_type:complete